MINPFYDMLRENDTADIFEKYYPKDVSQRYYSVIY